MAARPPTRTKRFLKLAGMTASVASRYAKTRVKNLFQDREQAERERRESMRLSGGRIAETLGELKGAVMKVGQMASMAADILPKELAAPLRQLQKHAPPMAYEVIAEQIEAELGAPPEVLFRRFDREPFASASIGQVHRALTDDGREVVSKVQYPGVEEAIDSDLMQLKLALQASGLAALSRRDLKATFKELRVMLHQELDYCLEADNVRAFRAFHGPRHPFVEIPKVVGERSSQRVLTLTYVAGDSLEQARAYAQPARDRLGEHLLTFVASEVFEHGWIHGDPNPANFAFRPDGTLVVYDFGCTKRLQPVIVQAGRDIAAFGLAGEYDRIDDCMLRLGARNPDGPAVEADYYATWCDIFAGPFERHPTFDFARAQIHKEVIKQIPAVVKRMSSFRPAKELIFLDRMLVGHYGILTSLGARLPVLERLQPFLEQFDVESLVGPGD